MSELKGRNRISGYPQLIATFLVVFGFLLLAQGFGAGFMSLFGLSQTPDGHLVTSGNPENLRLFLILSQVLGTLIGLVLVPLLYLLFLRPDLWTEITEFTPQKTALFAPLGILLLISAIPTVSALGLWNTQLLKSVSGIEALVKLEALAKEMTGLILNTESTLDLIVVIFVVAVVPGVAEELIFRGILQNEFRKHFNPHLAVLFSAGLFSFIHFQFFGFFPRWYLGILLGYIYLYSGNLYLSMLAHFFNNLLAILWYYFHQKGTVSLDPDALDNMAMPLPIIFASVSITAMLLLRLWRMRVAPATTLNIDQV